MSQQIALSFAPNVEALATQHQLGAPVAEYRRWLRPAAIVYSVLLVVAGLLVLIAGTGSDGAIVSLIIGLVLFVCGLIAPFIFLLNRSQRVYVFAEGLVRTKGSTSEVVRWDQVDSMLQAIVKVTYRVLYAIPVARIVRHTYTVRRTDGTSLVFRDSLRGVEALGDRVSRETARYLFPKALAAYHAGQQVAFGDLTISKQGIGRKGKALPWTEYQSVEVVKGVAKIQQRGKRFSWASVQVRKVPNLLVFLNLLESIQREQRQGQATR